MANHKGDNSNNKREVEEHTVAICGGGGVGKSSITVQFVKHIFDSDYDPTIEDSYRNQIMVDKKVCVLNIVDTAGQDEYKSLRTTYMRSCEGFLLVFDMTDRNSLETLVEYVTDIERVKESSIFPVVLCANKSDLVSEHFDGVKEAADSFRRQYLNNCPYFETSAKERINIDESFSALVRQVRSMSGAGDNNDRNRNRSGSGLFSSVSHSKDTKSDLNNIRNIL